MWVITHDINWRWEDNDGDDSVPQNAVVGAYSPEGIPVYVVLANIYIPGNHEEGNAFAEYMYMFDIGLRSTTWQYLVVDGDIAGVFAMVNPT